jgi:DNA-binding MarR family transcriptional regulator/GNAT superfamily N-acetyltransferase
VAGPVITDPRATDPTAGQVAQVRAFNRFYTNVIGVLHGMYLDSPYTLTEGRVLFEIARQPAVPVSWLRQALDIDAGYLSRVLTRFEAEGLALRHRSAADARRQEIAITKAGRAALADLDARAARHVGALLDGADCGQVLKAMSVITDELGRPTSQAGPGPRHAEGRTVTLRSPEIGDLGWVLQRHAVGYAEEFGWDAGCEAVFARIIAEYPGLRDQHPDRSAGWIAEVDGAPAGSIFCVPDSETTARLRLLLVEPWARGLGLGTRLVEECLRFARDAGYADIVLWTYDMLAGARRTYQSAGFTLASEHPEYAFGHHMMSQTWSRPL